MGIWQVLAMGALGIALVLHGLGLAVLPMRAADALAPASVAPAVAAFSVIGMVGFVAAGLGALGVRPLSSRAGSVALFAGVCALGAQLPMADATLWPGVLLSLVLPVLTAVALPSRAGARAADLPGRPWWKRVGDVLGVVFLAWVAASASLWPWHRAWGTTGEERMMTLPGDRDPRTPQFEIMHAVTIAAPPSAVWPWLVQLGQDRAGFYSYDWLERLFLADVHNAREIRPEWQARMAGDRVYATQPGYLGGVFGERPGWTVDRVEPGQAMVLANWGAFVLLPAADGTTRFLIRSTISHERIPVWAAAVNLTAFELPHFIMQRKMMLTIKALAEGAPGVRG
jgi:hypothetical protein